MASRTTGQWERCTASVGSAVVMRSVDQWVRQGQDGQLRDQAVGFEQGLHLYDFEAAPHFWSESTAAIREP